MNHDDPHHRKPPRAEPLQPDFPGRGDEKQEKANPQGDKAEAARKHKEQSETAIENVREGYGGS